MRIFTIFYFIILYSICIYAQSYLNIPIDADSSYDSHETSISINPSNLNQLFVTYNLFLSSDLYKPGFAFSTDSGLNWEHFYIEPLPLTYTHGFDPSCSFDLNNNAFYTYIASYGGLGQVYASKTTDLGGEWTHSPVSSDDIHGDKPYMVINNISTNFDGRIYVSWVHIDASQTGSIEIKFAYSTDHGNNFIGEKTIAIVDPTAGEYISSIPTNNTLPAEGLFVHAPSQVVDLQGNVYVFWIEQDKNQGSAAKIYFKKSTDGGENFPSEKSLAANLSNLYKYEIGQCRVSSWPSAVYSSYSDRIYITFTEYESGLLNAYFKYYEVSTEQWSGKYNVSNISSTHRFMPWISGENDGIFSIAYYAGDENGIDLYLTEIHESQNIFVNRDKIVSNTTSDPDNVIDERSYFDYIGIATSGEGNSYPVWVDFRNGNADIYGAHVNPPPIAPTGFYITGDIGENPTLHWDPNVELDLDGYNIYQRFGQGSWSLLTTVDKYTTSFTDPGVTITGGKFDPVVCYNISAFDLAGNDSEQFWRSRCVTSNTVQKKTEEHASIFEYSLSEAFPNPFNPTTKIKYSVGIDAFVTIRVLDVLGNVVEKLVDEEKPAGEYSVSFNASNLPSGIYFYRITSGKFTATKKLILLK